MFGGLVFTCVLNACLGLFGSDCRHNLFFHKGAFLLGVVLVAYIWSAEALIGALVGFVTAFVVSYGTFEPWEGKVGEVEIFLHLIVVPLSVFFLFPRHIPETNFALGRPMTVIVFWTLLALHFIRHPPKHPNQTKLYIFWFIAIAATLLFF